MSRVEVISSPQRRRWSAVYFYSPHRRGEHPERHLAGYSRILQADAYAGLNVVFQTDRKPGPITKALCCRHSTRKLFELVDVASKARDKTTAVISPMAFQAVQKFDAVFALERSIHGLPTNERLAARRRDVAPLIKDLVDLRTREQAKLSRHNDVTKPMDYMLTRLDDFRRFLEGGRICLTNNAAERPQRGNCLGQKIVVIRRLRSRC